jgi:hypothetical protein
VSRLLDDAIRIPGTQFRIGLDPIFGIAPVSGDLVAMVASLYIVFEGVRADLPRKTLLKMVSLVVVDAVVGSVPVLGTVFDAFWKANRRNVAILESHVEPDAA